MHVFSTLYRSSLIALWVQEKFSTADNSAYLRKGRVEVWKRGVQQVEEVLKNNLAGSPAQEACQLWRGGKTGAWMGCIPQW